MSQVGQRQRVSLPVDNDRKIHRILGLIVQGNSSLTERVLFLCSGGPFAVEGSCKDRRRVRRNNTAIPVA
jgi:hypothetical protein